MGQLFYNRLKNGRIKSMGLGTILVLGISLMLFIITERTASGQTTDTFPTVLLSFIIPGLVLLIGLIPFGQVIESFDNKEFATYYKLGRLKFKQQKWDKADNVSLEQDEKRFYCVVIRTTDGQTLQMEKYPTLDEADHRLSEFKKLFN